MSNQTVHVLSVNGGEVETLLGVFATEEGYMAKIKSERDGGNFGDDEYRQLSRKDKKDKNITYVYVWHRDYGAKGYMEWSLVFTVTRCEVQP